MELTTGGATNLYYFQRNLQGDVVAIYDTNGTLKAKYLYDAYGNCTVIYGADLDIAKANPIRYRGYYYDSDTGLYYCNARYYSPKWRRFISPDDTAYLDTESVNGLNLYCYCNNDPVYFKLSSPFSTGCPSICDKHGASPTKPANTSQKHSSAKFHLFGYEWRESAGWEYSPTMVAGLLGIIGISSYLTHTKRRSGMLYVFAGVTSDVTSFLGTTLYRGVGVDLFGILGAGVQRETLGVGVSVSIGNFSISLNANLLASTSITFAWDTDFGNGYTRTDGFTAGVNTVGLLAVATLVYLWLTTGFVLPSVSPKPQPGII